MVNMLCKDKYVIIITLSCVIILFIYCGGNATYMPIGTIVDDDFSTKFVC